MILTKRIFFVFIFLLLGACVSAPKLQKPLPSVQSNSIELYRSHILDQTAHTLQHLNKEKDILYYQTYGGAGAGLGLLAGPFGVAANIKMIESNTMKDVGVMGNKINSDIKVLFEKSVVGSGMNVSASGDGLGYKMNPYLLVEKTEGDQLMLATVILIETKEQFPLKYLVQLPVKYTVEQLASLGSAQQDKLNNTIIDGFNILLARVKKETTTDILSEKKITMKSEFLTPRFKFEMKGNLVEVKDDMVWVRIVGGVCGVYSTDIEYKLATK